MTGRNVSLHPLWHTAMPDYQHTVGLITQALSVVAIYLMVTKTPKTGRSFAKYLILLQVSISLVDLNFGFLASPIGLYPLPGGLCNGILCTWFGFSGHTGVVLMQFTTNYVALSVLFCFHFKFLAVLEMIRQQKNTYRVQSRVIIFILFNIPGIIHIPTYRYLENGAEFTRLNFPTLYYLFEDSKYHAFAYDPTLYFGYTVFYGIVYIFMMIFASVLNGVFLGGTFHLLRQRTTTMSDNTRKLQRKLMWLLICQTMLPLSIQLVPFGCYAYSTIANALNPDINNVVFCFQLTHGLAHTLIVILTTPSYRDAFLFWRLKRKDTIASTYSAITKMTKV